MHLIPELKAYVSVGPQSLEILRELQSEEDADFERFKAENPGDDFGNDEEWKGKNN